MVNNHDRCCRHHEKFSKEMTIIQPVQNPHIKILAASAANPSRTTNHEPRNLVIDDTGAPRGKADSRISQLSQTMVIAKQFIKLCRISGTPFPHPAPRTPKFRNGLNRGSPR